MAEEKIEKIIDAAYQVFMRYGFKRTTMGDIATAAKMSRPALYLVFPSKEDVFRAVVAQLTNQMLKEIGQNVGQIEGAEKKLIYAFDLWTVKPFEMMLASPDARDLYEGGFEFAGEAVTKSFAEFESLVAQILEPLVQIQTSLKLTSSQIAHLLVGALPGYKQAAQDAEQLRDLIGGLISITLAGLQAAAVYRTA